MATKGQYITSGVAFNQLLAGNLQNFMTRCLRDPTGGRECRAIAISTSTDKSCDLKDTRQGNNNFVSSVAQAWQSFLRPSWYLGRLFYIILVQYNGAFNDI